MQEKILIIDGKTQVLSPSLAAKAAKKAILQGKALQYREVKVNDNVEKHYGIIIDNEFYEKIPSAEIMEIPDAFWFRKWDIVGKKIVNPRVLFAQKSMRRGKLHIMLQGEWVRANKCTTHILFK